MDIGDEVLIRMLPDLDPELFGSGWRIGYVVDFGYDIIGDQLVLMLDDDGPAIYAYHIDYVSILSHADAEPVSANVFDG